MRDENKQLKPWLESWGAWRRLRLNISYPADAASCNPDLHIAKPIIEPLFKMPSFVYNKHLSPFENAIYNLERMRAMERVLREYHHIKRTETKPKRIGSVPDYNPHWRMNYIDRQIQTLPDRLREVIILRYEREYKVKEMPAIIGIKLDAVHKRLANAHQRLKLIPRLMVSRDRPIKNYSPNYKNYSN